MARPTVPDDQEQSWAAELRAAIYDVSDRADGRAPLNTRTSNYVLVLADEGKLVEMNVASANTLTVPPNSSVAFPVGSTVYVRQYGAGTSTITAGAGVTIRSRGSLIDLAGQYAEAVLTKRATDEWVLSGDIA